MTPFLPTWLSELYPFRPKRFMTPSGARMSYVDEGTGAEAVVMVHGNPTWSFYYRNLVQALRGKIRCIAPDHIGMGLSEKPQGYNYVLATRIADIEALVKFLGLKRVHLVVHDWGGAIGFGFAARNPELVGNIVILNTAAFPDIHIPKRIAFCRTPLLGKLVVKGLNGFAAPATWMAMNQRKLTEMEKAAYLWPYNNWNNRVAVFQFVADIPMRKSHKSYAVLKGVSTRLGEFDDRKILIAWGGKDFCFNDHFFDRWKRIYPTAQQMHMPDVGHYVLEDSTEALARVAGFLS